MRTAKQFTLTGSVQGVGMRWTCKRLADARNLGGWVRNNPDGTVSLAIEGDETDVDAFMADLDDRMGPYISEYRQESAETGKNRDGFDVVF